MSLWCTHCWGGGGQIYTYIKAPPPHTHTHTHIHTKLMHVGSTYIRVHVHPSHVIYHKLSRSLLHALTKNGLHTQTTTYNETTIMHLRGERMNVIDSSFVSVSVLRSTDKSNNPSSQASPAPSWTSIMFSHTLAQKSYARQYGNWSVWQK